MISKLISQNHKRDRKNNILFFSSMIISVIAFYIILSLSSQDVIIFLRKMESDAVERLLQMIPIFYIFTLFLLFFLIYYATNVQMERRKHEFGVYLTLGMKRTKLFFILLLEDMKNNVFVITIGLILGIFISELISILTVKFMGFGIIGHRFNISVNGIFFTIIGFFIVKIVVFITLSYKIIRKEIAELLFNSKSIDKAIYKKTTHILSLIFGISLLIISYWLGNSAVAWIGSLEMTLTVVLGTVGTILLFFGLRIVIEFIINLGKDKKLHVFNFRQIQEFIIKKSTMIAICSLLIFSALSLFGFGMAVCSDYINNIHLIDYTFSVNCKSREESLKTVNKVEIDKTLKDNYIYDLFDETFEIKIAYPKGYPELNIAGILNKINRLEDTVGKNRLYNNLSQKQGDTCYVISLSGYNRIRKSAGNDELSLENNQAALYMDNEFVSNEILINNVIATKPNIFLGDEEYKLTDRVEYLPLVADSNITVSFGLIVSDDNFDRYTDGDFDIYVNGILNKESVDKKGLANLIFETNEKLDKTSLSYESYVQNMGRRLFHMVATSYVTIYLSIIFIVIANTIIGVQFLTEQQKSRKRYRDLIYLGANYDILCKSSNKQINWYFGFPVIIAMINSFFGIRALLTREYLSDISFNFNKQMIVATVIILLLGFVEIIYIHIVKKCSNKFLATLMKPVREE